jgi:DNA-binding transcriptional LysR family regulator
MSILHVEAFDLNLLLAFDALWTERHVTRAARRVGLTQSAMSHALARLRLQLDDPLFVPTPRGLVPTPRAHALAPPLGEALALVRHAVRPTQFAPATLRRTFTIGSNDYGDVALLPQLVARLEQEAPGVRLILRPVVGDGERALLDGQHDLMFGVPHPAAADVHGETLFQDRFVSLLRAGHPAARRPLTLERFVALRHLLISPQGVGEAAVDVALRAHGLQREIAVRVPYFLSAPLVVAQSDLIVTMPERVARAVAAQQRFVVRQPPVALPSITFNMFWHARNDADPLHRWMRQLIEAVARPRPSPAKALRASRSRVA